MALKKEKKIFLIGTLLLIAVFAFSYMRINHFVLADALDNDEPALEVSEDNVLQNEGENETETAPTQTLITEEEAKSLAEGALYEAFGLTMDELEMEAFLVDSGSYFSSPYWSYWYLVGDHWMIVMSSIEFRNLFSVSIDVFTGEVIDIWDNDHQFSATFNDITWRFTTLPPFVNPPAHLLTGIDAAVLAAGWTYEAFGEIVTDENDMFIQLENDFLTDELLWSVSFSTLVGGHHSWVTLAINVITGEIRHERVYTPGDVENVNISLEDATVLAAEWLYGEFGITAVANPEICDICLKNVGIWDNVRVNPQTGESYWSAFYGGGDMWFGGFFVNFNINANTGEIDLIEACEVEFNPDGAVGTCER